MGLQITTIAQEAGCFLPGKSLITSMGKLDMIYISCMQLAAVVFVIFTALAGCAHLQSDSKEQKNDLAAMPVLGALATADRPDNPDDMERQIRGKIAGNGERQVEYRSPEAFYGIATTVPKDVEEEMRMKKSWHEGCPVPIAELSYLVMTHIGFDGKPRIGELVLHNKLALPAIKIFADLYSQKFPIERMELIERYDANDDSSMEANNSSAFNCRDVTGKPGVYSKHSYGSAIDINPLQNPYITAKGDPLKIMGWDGSEDKGVFLRRSGYDVKSPVAVFCTGRPTDCLVLPTVAAAYTDRTTNSPGYLLPDSAAVKAFTDRGFDWGGNWERLMDYQHFEYDSSTLLKK